MQLFTLPTQEVPKDMQAAGAGNWTSGVLFCRSEEAGLFQSEDHLSGLDHGWFGQGLY